MKTVSSIRQTKPTLLHHLIFSMLAFAAVLLVAVICGLLLLGQFRSPEKELSETLQLQMEVFENDVSSTCEEMAVSGNLLSQSMTIVLEKQLDAADASFAQLNDNPTLLAAVQSAMIQPLQHILLQSDCSGAFVLLNATVNTQLAHSSQSRSGLYLQRNAAMEDQKTLLLYRGMPEIGKANGIMPHRKWHLEVQADQLPQPVFTFERKGHLSYSFSQMVQLPGTSERAVLMMIPLVGRDGEEYGICGFELSQSYFQVHMAQPTKLSHLTCLVGTIQDGQIDTAQSLSCGAAGGYYLAPNGVLSCSSTYDQLLVLSGETISYAAMLHPMWNTEAESGCVLVVMTPQANLDRAVTRHGLQVLMLLLLLLFFTISCCFLFSRRFLRPILHGLEQLKSDTVPKAQSGFQEIDNLFDFLEEKDHEHERALLAAQQERLEAETAYQTVQKKYETAQSELSILAYNRAREIDPDEYEVFLQGIQNLTPTERLIFGYYLEGHSVKEILEICDIKESTLRYHNRNIYSKLGVNSLKQLLRYAALMQWKEQQ